MMMMMMMAMMMMPPRASQDGLTRPQEEGHTHRKHNAYIYIYSYIEGIIEQVGSQAGPKRPTDGSKMDPRGPKVFSDAQRCARDASKLAPGSTKRLLK